LIPVDGRKRIENVPALLVHGAQLSDRLRLIERLTAATGDESRCAVMLTSPTFTGPQLSATAARRPNVVVRASGGGCPCCIGRVSFQVAVTRILREVRPDRLIIELLREEHVRQAIAVLEGGELAAALRVAGVLHASDLS
jgi:hypothetical protein